MKVCYRQLARLAVHGRRGGPSGCVSQQRAIFDKKVPEFKQELPDEVIERLDMTVKSAAMDPEDRVLDVGAGPCHHVSLRYLSLELVLLLLTKFIYRNA